MSIKKSLIIPALIIALFIGTPSVFAGAKNSGDAPAARDEAKEVQQNLPKLEAGEGVGLDATGNRFPSNLPKFQLEEKTEPIQAIESVFLRYIINPIFLISGGVAVIMILYAAARIITTRGEEEGLTAAKTTLTWAAAGLAVIMMAYTIVRNLSSILSII